MENVTTTVDPAVAKAAELAAKSEAKAAAAAKRAADAAAKAEAKAAEKQAKAEALAAKKAADVEAKKQAKADAEAAKSANKQPMQNDVRRPKAETTCGKCWAVYDDLSNKRGSYCAIGDAKPVLEAQGINEATIRTQYAHWRKFNGVTGRIESDKPVVPAQVAPPAPPQPAS